MYFLNIQKIYGTINISKQENSGNTTDRIVWENKHAKNLDLNSTFYQELIPDRIKI